MLTRSQWQSCFLCYFALLRQKILQTKLIGSFKASVLVRDLIEFLLALKIIRNFAVICLSDQVTMGKLLSILTSVCFDRKRKGQSNLLLLRFRGSKDLNGFSGIELIRSLNSIGFFYYSDPVTMTKAVFYISFALLRQKNCKQSIPAFLDFGVFRVYLFVCSGVFILKKFL